jgi:hypothetical protein
MKHSLTLLFACTLFVSCEKEFSLENVQPQKQIRKYQLTAFYSEIPVDFDESDDVINLETDLWKYVNDYIKDDIDEFTDNEGEVLVHQNEKKIAGSDEPILYKTYSVGSDPEGMYMNFLGPDYEPLFYRLQEWNDDYFIVYVMWRPGVTVYSRFERVE